MTRSTRTGGDAAAALHSAADAMEMAAQAS